jgi:hypothetical protein
MRNRLTALAVLLLLTVAFAPPPAHAGPYDLALCPIVGGKFLIEGGQLWIAITKQDGVPVKKRTEKIANPLDEKSHRALAKRGAVTVEVHQAEGGGLFVHWGTLADDK